MEADVYAVKANADTPGAYSARGLGHGVLVPNAPRLDINLGVTGREPLNNQPYFRIMRVSRDIPIRGNARPALEKVCDILEQLDQVGSEREARAALRAFIHVRRKHSPTYGRLQAVAEGMSADRLAEAIESFVSEKSEGGRRAQAVVAGLMDLFAGRQRVETGRINDPDRHFPGDVGVRTPDGECEWEKVIEVRDKRVSEYDLDRIIEKAATAGVGEAAVVAVAAGQEVVSVDEEVRKKAAQKGTSLTVFFSWGSFVSQVLFWCAPVQLTAVIEAPKLIHERIIELEVSEEGAALWLKKVGQ